VTFDLPQTNKRILIFSVIPSLQSRELAPNQVKPSTRFLLIQQNFKKTATEFLSARLDSPIEIV